MMYISSLIFFTILIDGEPPTEQKSQEVRFELGGSVTGLIGADPWPRNKNPLEWATVYSVPKHNYRVSVRQADAVIDVVLTNEFALLQDEGIITEVNWRDGTEREWKATFADVKRLLRKYKIAEQKKVVSRLARIDMNPPKDKFIIRGLISNQTTIDIQLFPHVDLKTLEPKTWTFIFTLNYHSKKNWDRYRDIDEEVWKKLSTTKSKE